MGVRPALGPVRRVLVAIAIAAAPFALGAVACGLGASVLSACHVPVPQTAPPPDNIEDAEAPAVLKRLQVAVQADEASLANELVAALKHAGFKTTPDTASADLVIDVQGDSRYQQGPMETRWYFAVAGTILAGGRPVTREKAEYGGHKVGNKVATTTAASRARRQTVAWFVAKLTRSPQLLAHGNALADAAADADADGAATPAPVDAPARALRPLVIGSSAGAHPCAEAAARGVAAGLGAGEPLLGAGASPARVRRAIRDLAAAAHEDELVVVHVGALVSVIDGKAALTTGALDDAAPKVELGEVAKTLDEVPGRALLLLDLRGGSRDGQNTMLAALRAVVGGADRVTTVLRLRPRATDVETCEQVEGQFAAAVAATRGQRVVALTSKLPGEPPILIGNGAFPIPAKTIRDAAPAPGSAAASGAPAPSASAPAAGAPAAGAPSAAQ